MKLFLDGIPRITEYDDNIVLVLRQMDEDGKVHSTELVFFPEEAVQVGALLQAYGQKLLDRYRSVVKRVAFAKFDGNIEPVRLAMLELLEEQPLFDSGSSEDMRRLIAKAEALASVLRGLDDLKHGRLVEGPEVDQYE